MSTIFAIFAVMKFVLMSIVNSIIETVPATVWAGVVGAISRLLIGPKQTFSGYLSGLVVGIGAAVYIAPIIAPAIGLDVTGNGVLAIAYVTGTIGSNIVDSLVRTGKNILDNPSIIAKSNIFASVLEALADKIKKNKPDEPK